MRTSSNYPKLLSEYAGYICLFKSFLFALYGAAWQHRLAENTAML